jgi:hypothetical protein
MAIRRGLLGLPLAAAVIAPGCGGGAEPGTPQAPASAQPGATVANVPSPTPAATSTPDAEAERAYLASFCAAYGSFLARVMPDLTNPNPILSDRPKVLDRFQRAVQDLVKALTVIRPPAELATMHAAAISQFQAAAALVTRGGNPGLPPDPLPAAGPQRARLVASAQRVEACQTAGLLQR